MVTPVIGSVVPFDLFYYEEEIILERSSNLGKI